MGSKLERVYLILSVSQHCILKKESQGIIIKQNSPNGKKYEYKNIIYTFIKTNFSTL